MSNTLLQGARLPWPAPWPEIFGREAPLFVEIGFGSGHFLLDLAQKRPEVNILGVEISLPSLRRTEKKLQQMGLAHGRLVQGDAWFILWALCAPGSIAALYANFPDPWPKAAHHHRRLINGRFLHLAATRMVTGACLEIATDHAEYAAVIASHLAQTPYFDSRLPVPFITQDEARPRTKYEAKALAEGRTCHYFQWQRNSIAAPDLFPIPQEKPMPHIILRSPLSLEEIGRQFVPQRIAIQATNVKLLELYRSLRDGSLFIEAYVDEEPLSQRVGLTIRRRDGEELIVGLHEVGFPRTTPGLHAAIYHLAMWVIGLHPETQVVHNNLQIDASSET